MDKTSNKLFEKAVMQWNEDAVRFPQTFSMDAELLYDSFGTDNTMVRDLLVFFASKFKANLFNFSRFTLGEFAKKMGYDVSNLRRTRHFTDKNVPILKNHRYDGNFEVVLYRMLKENIVASAHGAMGDFNKSFQIFTDLNVLYSDPGNPNSKHFYDVTLSQTVIDSFLRQYHVLSLDDYVNAGKINSRDSQTVGIFRNLYVFLVKGLHLARFKRVKGLPACFETTVDEISRVLHYDMERPSYDRKYKVKKALDKIQSNLTNMQFTYEFFKMGKFFYHVRFFYSEQSIAEYEKKTDAMVINRLYLLLFENFRNKYQNEGFFRNEETEVLFHRWLSNGTVDRKLKADLVNKAYNDAINIRMDEEHAYSVVDKGFAELLRQYKEQLQQSNGQSASE